MSTIEDLLKAIRSGQGNPAFIPVLEQAKAVRDGPKLVQRRKKRRKTDIRTLKKRKKERSDRWRAEKGDHIREYNAGIRAMYFHLRREVKRRLKAKVEAGKPTEPYTWELTLPEWITMWLSCPAVEVGRNVYKPAWKCRGRSNSDVQLERIDKNKSWNINNLSIWHRQKQIWPNTN